VNSSSSPRRIARVAAKKGRASLLAVLLAALAMLIGGCAPVDYPTGQARGADLPDDVSGPQVRVLYVLPSNGVDHHLDTDGTIARSVAAWNDWLFGQTGKRVILDTHDGALDVGFARLTIPTDDISGSYITALPKIDAQLSEWARTAPEKLFLVYYDGPDTGLCGTSNNPDMVQGHLSVLYLGTCGQVGTGSNPTGADLSALHELFHNLGAVSPSCPHSSSNVANMFLAGSVLPLGHVMDDPNDLMWYGNNTDSGQVHIDAAHDDYWGSTNCRDVSKSALLTPTDPDAYFPPAS